MSEPQANHLPSRGARDSGRLGGSAGKERGGLATGEPAGHRGKTTRRRRCAPASRRPTAPRWPHRAGSGRAAGASPPQLRIDLLAGRDRVEQLVGPILAPRTDQVVERRADPVRTLARPDARALLEQAERRLLERDALATGQRADLLLDPRVEAIAAILRLPEPRQELYLDVILGAIPDPVRRLVEVHMYKHEYQSDFARKYFAQGRQEGTLLAVLAVAQAKLGDLSEDLQARIRAVASDAQLTEILVALSGAPDATAARAVLDRFAPAAPA